LHLLLGGIEVFFTVFCIGPRLAFRVFVPLVFLRVLIPLVPSLTLVWIGLGTFLRLVSYWFFFAEFFSLFSSFGIWFFFRGFMLLSHKEPAVCEDGFLVFCPHKMIFPENFVLRVFPARQIGMPLVQTLGVLSCSCVFFEYPFFFLFTVRSIAFP